MLEIIKASLSDLHILSDMEKTIFDYDVITGEQMNYLLNSKTAIVAKAVLNNLVVGYVILLMRKNSRVLRIYSLGVSAQERRFGFGRKLLHYAEQCAAETGRERVHLELHKENIAGLIFYLSEGYCLYGRRDHYYSDGSQALLLRKYILPGEQS